MARWLLPDKIGLFTRQWKKAVGTTLIAATMMTGVQGKAIAKDIGYKAARAVKVAASETTATKVTKLRDVIHTVVGMTDEGASATYKKNVAKMLGRTAVHESAGLKYKRQIAKYVGGKPVYGPARSFWQVEPATAKWLTTEYALATKRVPVEGKEGVYETILRRPDVLENIQKATNLSREQIEGLSYDEVANLLEENQFYAAMMARYKYKTRRGLIPETLEEQATYWSDEYQSQGLAINEKKFIKSNEAFNKVLGHSPAWGNMEAGEAIGSDFKAGQSWIGPHPTKSPWFTDWPRRRNKEGEDKYIANIASTIKRTFFKNHTAGLVNNVLHKNKTNHMIADQNMKANFVINKSIKNDIMYT